MPEIASSHSYSVVQFTGQPLVVVGPKLKRIVGEIDDSEKLLVLRDNGATVIEYKETYSGIGMIS